MKKNGKKWRQLQKEKEERKENMKVGEPFSRAKNKKHLCLHYGGIPGGFVPGHCYSLLAKISETECMCCVCGKVFPIEKYDQMEKLAAYMGSKGCITDSNYIIELSKGLEPVYYRRISENEVEIIEEAKDIMIPRYIGILGF